MYITMMMNILVDMNKHFVHLVSLITTTTTENGFSMKKQINANTTLSPIERNERKYTILI